MKEAVPSAVKHWIRTTLLRQQRTRVLPMAECVKAERLWSSSPQTVSTPLLNDLPLWDTVADLSGPVYTSPEVHVDLVQDALLCTTNRTLLAPDRTIIAESLSTRIGDRLPDQPHAPFRGEYVFGSDVQALSGTVAFFQFHRRNHYHTLVDALPRLYPLHHVDLSSLPQPVRLVCSDLSRVERALLEELIPAGIEVCEVEAGLLIRADAMLHVSFFSRQSVGYLDPAYLSFFRSKVLPDRPPRRDRRILVSRQSTGNRRIKNADEIRPALLADGFEVVELETLTLDEQIDLFYDAHTVVATHGASLANLLFAGPETKVVELFPHPFMIPTYYLLSRALGLDYACLLGNEAGRYDDFAVDSTALRSLL